MGPSQSSSSAKIYPQIYPEPWAAQSDPNGGAMSLLPASLVYRAPVHEGKGARGQPFTLPVLYQRKEKAPCDMSLLLVSK